MACLGMAPAETVVESGNDGAFISRVVEGPTLLSHRWVAWYVASGFVFPVF